MTETRPTFPTRLLTPKEAAGFLTILLAISTRTLNRIVKQGELPVVRVSGSNRFKQGELHDARSGSLRWAQSGDWL